MKHSILRGAVVGLFVIASVTVAIERGSAINSRRVDSLSQTPTTAQSRTAGQAYKNIKVLQDLPEAQLLPVMNFFTASLGVRCNYCHLVKDGNLVLELDDKPEKNTAREMIKMVLGVNKTTFRGALTVSCYTCHRGRTSPVGVPTLPLPAPSPRPQPSPAVSSGATPSQTPAPTAEQILDKYVAALGGQAAIDKLTSRVVKGTFTNVLGTAMPYETHRVAPNKVYQNYTTPQGTIEIIFNGTSGWEKSPRGMRELPPAQLASLTPSAEFFHDMKLKQQFTRMSPPRKDQIEGRDVYVIRATRNDGNREQLYFDADSGLLLRRITLTETLVGVVPDQVDFDDYREVDGVKVPFTVRTYSVNVGNPMTTIKTTEIKFNLPVDDTKFNKPAAPKPATP